MELGELMSLIQASGFIPQAHFYKFVMDNTTKACDKCLRFADEIFMENDPKMPQLPLHPNCDCQFIEVGQQEYEQQENFEFGYMLHEKWDSQAEKDKHLWCNTFRKQFGNAIDKYARQYNIPKELLAGIIANEMLEWKFPDGTQIDGIRGGGIGYAQIALKTARKHGINGSALQIIRELNSYDGSVKITAKILKNYFDEFRNSIKNNKLGKGFQQSTLYYMAKPYILERNDFVNMKVPEWLLNSMCAVWNSEIAVIYAKDNINDDNYSNAYDNGSNSSYLLKYLPKLVNE